MTLQIPTKMRLAHAFALIIRLILANRHRQAYEIAENIGAQMKYEIFADMIREIMQISQKQNNPQQRTEGIILKNEIATRIADSLKNKKIDRQESKIFTDMIDHLIERNEQEFVACLRQKIKYVQNPENSDDHLAKLNQLMEKRHFAAFIEEVQKIPPQNRDGDLWMKVGMAATMEEKPDMMREGFEKAAALSPKNGVILGQWGLGELFIGDVKQGLKLYESRKLIDSRYHRKPSPRPEWNGTPFGGQKLFIHQELGFGDAIQFARYIPKIKKYAKPNGKIILGCDPKIRALFETMNDIDDIVPFIPGETKTLPQHDIHASLFSMPFIFNCNFDEMPLDKPYINVAEKKIFARKTKKIKIGLIWSSSTSGGIDKNIPTPYLKHLKEIKNAQIFSLQFERELNHTIEKDEKLNFIDNSLEPWNMDFLELAQTINALDLLITIDTAAAHIAGAMFKPTFLILPAVKRSDWRWRPGLYKKSWYPSIDIMQPAKIGDWQEPLSKMSKKINQGKLPKINIAP